MADGLPGNSHDDGAARNLFDDNGVGSDPAVVTDLDRAQHFRAGADDHAVADGGVTLAGLGAGSAERDPVVDGDVVAYLRRFADHHPRRVIDEQTLADDCAGVDVHAGQNSGDLTEGARSDLCAASPQPVTDPMAPDGVHARVGEHDLQRAGNGGITVLCRLDVAPESGEHG
ncbi:MAG: hypothetical protein QOE12_59 [Mycobacterium sp.]|nr:hypothetical protein [Mycobacterium sp.]